MAYQALYRKYRPVSFDGVAGQKPIVKTLQNAVRQHRIAHAYLFCGPRGTGKTSIAKIFAKMLNCESEENAPCGKCHNCIEFQIGSHPDIIEIDAASGMITPVKEGSAEIEVTVTVETLSGTEKQYTASTIVTIREKH